MKVVKRNGTIVDFDTSKIINAIRSANNELDKSLQIEDAEIEKIAEKIKVTCGCLKKDPTVEEIQNLVEDNLMELKAFDLARNYIQYRYKRKLARDKYKDLMDAVENKLMAKDVQNQNANVDEKSFGGRAGEASDYIMKQYALDYCMSKMSKENHLNNEIYIHDLSSYAVGNHNCLSIPFDKLLAEGFNTRQTDVRPAGSINSALQLVAVIFQLQSLQQFGGVSATHLDHTLVPYVRKSFLKHYKDGMKYIKGEENPNLKYDKKSVAEISIENTYWKQEPKVYKYALEMTKKETYQAVEALYHNLNTLSL